MNYDETLEYLYAQLPMFTRVGAAAYKKDLHNTLALCELLNNPHKKFKSIHIAGTNGKGSCSHMLASILQEAGYKTGLYTSPHIKDFGERIRVNGQMIEQHFVTEFVATIKPAIDKIQPSFFELTVAMAFEYFAEKEVDIAVIETGLGGRLDSTNVILPILSVITNIGYDHMNLLGENLEMIASEKAGIIKSDVPVVIGKTQSETAPIFTAVAKKANSKIRFADTHFSILTTNKSLRQLHCTVKNNFTQQTKSYRLDLTGNYQQENLCTVLSSIDALNESVQKITETAVQNGLAHTKINTGFRGRWEILQEDPLLIVDVAHNEAGIRQVLDQLQGLENVRKLHFVMGFAKDKDLSHVLSVLPKNAAYYFTEAHIPRAMSATDLLALANEQGLAGDAYPHVNRAIESAMQNAAKEDIIIVCGSFYVIAEMDAMNE